MTGPMSELRLMAWNLCRGGTGTPAGDVLDQMTDLIGHLAPDVLCCVETEGATDRIVAGLHAAGHPDYRGHRLAVDGTDDNLAIVTRLPVLDRLPAPAGRTVDSYNFGGLRLQLPDGGDVAVFDTWLRFDVAIADALEATVAEIVDGAERTRNDEQLALLELPQLANIEEILTEHLPAALADSPAGQDTPVLLAGGFNTESHLDLAAGDPDYRRQVRPQWQVTARLAKAGFADAYRLAHPDPAADPGGTFDRPAGDQRLPHRIDYVFVDERRVRVRAAETVRRRLPCHGPGGFYSDHAALVVDASISASGPARSLTG
ncbi:hypothetical protein Athai_36070 [Actinocatenispora thailandica]|uniref:Endonuclease/exonuclease/phosphatase domain-containing protein n=1 Tax=Actinocatenispora thailandica TaxID=227318 RepID=A0A7R7DQT5_9ACTN|nr:endonuclease/exonuclease/phosphatase family protein [Actinocatenispora thailandica]BCJ36104.1 hypothetical protein Athai_36070 [Actinocatenispora thailandica]